MSGLYLWGFVCLSYMIVVVFWSFVYAQMLNFEFNVCFSYWVNMGFDFLQL